VKRYFFNRVASEGKFTVVATGHNLDDEAARLLGNLLHWHRDHLSRQHRTSRLGRGAGPQGEAAVAGERAGNASYGFLKGIDYVTEECPMSEDATSLVYKEVLSLIEEQMPGTRTVFTRDFSTPGILSGGHRKRGPGQRRIRDGHRRSGGSRNAPRVRVVRRAGLGKYLLLLPAEGARPEARERRAERAPG